MRILFIGDISGKPGRETVREVLPSLIKSKKIDFVIANCENAAGGRGVTREVIEELQNYGVNFFTSGEHVWGVKTFLQDLMDPNLPLVRPYNYEGKNEIPGKGYEIIDLPGKDKIVIAALIGQTFMSEMARSNIRNPFWAADEMLDKLMAAGIRPGKDIIVVDFHAEATSEKVSLAYYLRNRVSAVFGTHTHVATADARLIENTAFVTDTGMAGPLDASLWVDFASVIHNFKYPFKESFKMQEEGRRIFNSVLVEIEKGVAQKIARIDRVLD